MRAAILFLAATTMYAADPPPGEKPATPTITTEHERDFERARANYAEAQLMEATGKTLTAARLPALQAAFAVVQKDCPGVQRPDAEKPLVCPPVPVKEVKAATP